MKGKTCTSSKNYVEQGGRERTTANQLSGDVIFGDLVWVKLHDSSWWPAQVIDDKTLSERNKSGNRSANDILVRLYGSYKFMYVDPVKCHLEFDKILKENSGNHSEIFKKALKQVLSSSGSARSKKEILKSEGAIRIGSSSEKMLRQKIIHKKKEADTPASPRISKGLSTANSAPARLKNKNPHKGKTEKTKSEKRKQVVESGVEPKSSKPASNTKRRRTDAGTPQSAVKKGNSLPKSIGATKNKDLMPNKRNSVRMSTGKPSTASKSQLSTKKGSLPSEKDKAVKTQDLVKYSRQKKLEFNSPSTRSEHCANKQERRSLRNRDSLAEKSKKESENKAWNHVNVKKNPKPKDQTSAKLSSSRIPKAKEAEATSKQKHGGTGSTTNSKGKSQELSARRIKVMQSLGLIAPAGSPFG